MINKVAFAQSRISAALDELRELFTDECRVTFIMRQPSNPEGYIITTDDPDLEAVERTIAHDRAKNSP